MEKYHFLLIAPNKHTLKGGLFGRCLFWKRNYFYLFIKQSVKLLARLGISKKGMKITCVHKVVQFNSTITNANKTWVLRKR